MMRTNQAAVFSIALLVTGLFAACSDVPPITTGSSSGSGGAGGGESSSSSSSSTGGGGAGGDAGAGGAGGAAGAGGGSMATGRNATEIVSGGKYMTSDKYRMIYTIGQPSQIQSTVKSDKYRMQGGIVGATGSLK